MWRKGLVILCFSVGCLCIAGCYSTHVERDVSSLDAKQLRQNFFLFGLLRESQVDLTQECPRGVASFGDKFTVGDLLFTALTVGLYSPRTVFVRCET